MDLNEGVIVALIGLSGSVIGSLIGVIATNKLTQYRLQQLEKKVDLHNSVIDRVYALEEKTAVYDEKFKVENHRINDLEKYHR